jgi:hypothetical protein
MMKKILFVMCLLAIVSLAYAATYTVEVKNTDGGIAYTNSTKLLRAVTATGTGNIFWLQVPMSKHMCTVTWGGTVPTDTYVILEGGQDGTNLVSLASTTITASPTSFHIDKPSITHIRGNYVSKTDGDGTTSVTLTCTSGGL